MEREPAQNYDVIAIDAFSSDSIPVHLITREAMAVYLKHLKPDGVIAFHVTNRFLRLAPVVKAIAEEHGLKLALIVDEAEESDLAKTDWVLVTRNGKLLSQTGNRENNDPDRDHTGPRGLDRRLQQPLPDPQVEEAPCGLSCC